MPMNADRHKGIMHAWPRIISVAILALAAAGCTDAAPDPVAEAPAVTPAPQPAKSDPQPQKFVSQPKPDLAPASTLPAVVITVEPAARQTFAGLGANIFPWTTSDKYKQQVSAEENAHMAQLLWHDARFRSGRLPFHPQDYMPKPGHGDIKYYVDGFYRSGKLPAAQDAGLRELILSPSDLPIWLGDGHGHVKDEAIADYAALLASFIRDFKHETGVQINATGIVNEPNDRPIKFAATQWPTMIKSLRAALDAAGLQQVKIVAPESGNCDGTAYGMVDAIKADPAAWRALDGIATHSYNMAATPEMASRAAGKEFWITEAGGTFDGDEDAGDAIQAASVASRFLNDLNHGATHWQFFIGAELADPRGNTDRILKYEVEPFRLTVLQKYFYLKQLAETFDAGAAVRHCTSSLDGEMTYTYGKKPHIFAAAARNPDGTWGLGICNDTSPTFSADDDEKNFESHNSGRPAQAYTVTIRIAELAGSDGVQFAVHRSNKNINDTPTGTISVRAGEITVPDIEPHDLMTLRSQGASH